MNAEYRKIFADGLWNNNQALVALLGLCPLLAVTTNAVNGLGMGIATTVILLASNIVVSIIRNWVRPEVRLPVFMMVIASFVTTIELTMNALFFDLYKTLGIFIPLIVTNCAIIGRAEAYASKNSVDKAALDGLAMGLGFTAVLVLLGAMRELLGKGTLFAQAELLFGEGASWMTITLFDDYSGFLMALLPPGAFFGLGLIIALKNIIDKRREQKSTAPQPSAQPESAQGPA